MIDVYARLRPPGPTPEDDLCPLPLASPIKVMPSLGYNAIHCMACNLEIPPHLLALPANLVEHLAEWTAVYNAIDHLWLDSGAYERWAGDQLANVASPVNQRGLAVRAEIAPYRRCYYWLFQDQSVPGFVPVETCSKCGGSFRPYPASVIPQVVCDACGIVTVGAGQGGRGHDSTPVA